MGMWCQSGHMWSLLFVWKCASFITLSVVCQFLSSVIDCRYPSIHLHHASTHLYPNLNISFILLFSVDDTLDAMFEESGDEEEQDAIVNQVLDEIGIEVSGKVRHPELKSPCFFLIVWNSQNGFVRWKALSSKGQRSCAECTVYN